MTNTEYLNELRRVDSDVYSQLGDVSQIVIDLVQEIVQQLSREWDEEPIQRDELGAINYDIDVLLEVMNPDFILNISILKRVDIIIRDWCNSVEFINTALGIPKHKG